MFNLSQKSVSTYIFVFVFIGLCFSFANAQKTRSKAKPKPIQVQSTEKITVATAVVIDEQLSVLRPEPNLYAEPLQRMRVGRKIQVLNDKVFEGVTYYQVVAEPNRGGWVQADAVVTKARKKDDERLARLIQASEGFEQIERMIIFFDVFPNSPLCPPMMLLMGDLIESAASKMSIEATRKFNLKEMEAIGAPIHTFYLSYSGLDRYLKLGIGFVFNSYTKKIHYDGVVWVDLMKQFPKSSEAADAQKRIESLKEKLASHGKTESKK